MVNFYGPTEATVLAASRVLEAGKPVTIGAPIDGAGVLLLDDRLHPVPTGMAGELYLLGDPVARGYHGQSALTAGRFVAAPAAAGVGAGRRMYRTGDLARWTSDLGLEYLGRSDAQVQIRGFRVELGEIESALLAVPGVSEAIAVTDDRSGEVLVRAYIVGTPDLSATALRGALAQRLPRHMVPTSITLIDVVPLTPSGKLNRALLPAPPTSTEASRPPAPGLETIIAAAFGEVLGCTTVNADDDFFDLGGTSLSATTVIAGLQEAGHQFSVADLFASPTPGELAATLVEGTSATASPLVPLMPLRQPSDDQPPVFAIHPAVGLAWNFVSLRGALPSNVGLYGLQNPALSGARWAQSIGELATDYVDRIKAVSPGPYRLVGWSLGGLIAQEMAVQLREQGDDVVELILLDTYVLSDHTELHGLPKIGDLITEVGIGADQVPASASLPEVLAAISTSGGPFSSLSETELLTMYIAYVEATRLAVQWQPRVFNGNAILVDATVDPPTDSPAHRDWVDQISGTVSVREVPCTHARILDPANVAQYAAEFGKALVTEPQRRRIRSATAAAPALELCGVSKEFRSGWFGRGRSHLAVKDLDLTVHEGTIHAILGPNGAGKTTTVSMIATLLRPSAGSITVGGLSTVDRASDVRRMIGVSGQYAAVDGTLTGFENLRMVAQLYKQSRQEASRRARDLIEKLGLSDAADRPMKTYSGGMKRRLDLAGALINDPKLVILDEPTTGLDPRARRQIWQLVTDLADSGTTVLLTTQYLEEADELADDITVIDRGSVIARGTPESLKSDFGQTELAITVDQRADPVVITTALAGLGTSPPISDDGVHWKLAVDDGTRSSVAAVRLLTAKDVHVVDATVTAPTLDTVFLSLTSPDQQEASDVR